MAGVSSAFSSPCQRWFCRAAVFPEHCLAVFERGSGETLACGTGACAAVVAGIQRGRLSPEAPVAVQTRGGLLKIQWSGKDGAHVMMTGPAEPVFDGVIDL